MKVIKAGRKQSGFSLELTCSGKGNGGGGCGALLLVEQNDLFNTAHWSYDGTSEIFVTFKCPQCKVLTDITRDASIPNRGYDFITSMKLPNRTEWEKKYENKGN